MIISIEEIKPLGGLELYVYDVLNEPLWLEGDLTDYTDGSMEFTVNEIFFCHTDTWKSRATAEDYGLARAALQEAGFFEQIIDDIKERNALIKGGVG